MGDARNRRISEDDEIILKGRVYPAIQSCVGNRYKIVLGIFAFYAFILNSGQGIVSQNIQYLKIFGTIVFAFFIIHNMCNYMKNTKEQISLEKSWKDKTSHQDNLDESVFSGSSLEIIFSIVGVLAIIFLLFFTPEGCSIQSE